jgi:hypothetical protein
MQDRPHSMASAETFRAGKSVGGVLGVKMGSAACFADLPRHHPSPLQGQLGWGKAPNSATKELLQVATEERMEVLRACQDFQHMMLL